MLAALIGATSCEKSLSDYNKNHNEPEYGQINPVNMMQALITNIADCLVYRTWQLNGELIQYTVSGSSTNAYHRYVIPNTVSASSWSTFAQYAANADEMERLAKAQKNPNAQAIAITLKVLMLDNLSACYGDIPYTEAFGNINGEKNNQPKFDSQRTVYVGLIRDLELANSLYDRSSNTIEAPYDFLYGADIDKWQKFTNSLYLRVLMRMSNRNDDHDPDLCVARKIARVFVDHTTYPVFESNEDNATLYYDSVEPFVNYWGSTTSSSFTSSRRCCKTIIDMMNNPGDPRISMYFIQGGTHWEGRESGAAIDEMDVTGTASLNRSNLGQYSSPYSLMKYDEVLFIYCEAIKRGFIPGGESLVNEYYQKAVSASVRYWESINTSGTVITDTALSRFLAKIPYDGTLAAIMNQKYVANFWNGYEAWYDYKRTEYPHFVIGSATSNDHILPTRFAYPDNTANTNVANYQEQVRKMEHEYGYGDTMRTPVWFSLKSVNEGIQ